MTTFDYDISNSKLSSQGKLCIEWADRSMPVIERIRRQFNEDRPLAGKKIGACLHVTAETAMLMRTLKAGGAEVALCATNSLSTRDDVAASLVEDYGIPVFARRGEERETYEAHLNSVLDLEPDFTMDDGAELVSAVHRDRPDLIERMFGGTVDTTTGALKLRAMHRDEALKYPVVAVNDSATKHLFDNRFGTGQSTLDGIIRATNVLLAGKVVVVVGYGRCGRGVASRAVGLGAQVIVVELDPIRALEALLEGNRVASMSDAAQEGDLFITATGNKHVIRKKHFNAMQDGAMVCNTGHTDVELDLPGLRELARENHEVRPYVEQFKLLDGRRLYLLAEGRLINLTAAEGHPPAVMDMSFANQALATEFLVGGEGTIDIGVHSVPEEIVRKVARLKLESLKISIDDLTPEQEKYLDSWEEETEE
jgi:adenosylhomocysteinase